ncbi:single-stranded-DNA-specific exonuclease RecJ [Clostridium polyendosporum]|uniref:Single-stranded-DNA-specific exonuclease RecJ n=1 Tax=Clostridium polyendosporum TaxID=69208 RepID=A0A919RZ42_9CLOT|nr:single-stranded-DNA-specific exonuclease RecJ [Clostridium polyendosporum]GIM28135.1 single-stranded-DNA-specific exonuclease RecJ [Clostridium polyendosporum]
MKENWLLINRNVSDVKKLSSENGISQFTAKLLLNRDIAEIKDVKRFLEGSLDDLYDGFQMQDMYIAVRIVSSAIRSGKRIIIYGDYDCDGVVSTVILYDILKQCGANYNFYIPDREDEGYGMNSERIQKLKEEGYEVILTCDNGIAAFEQVALAKSLGMDVVITDHHDIPFKEKENGEKEFLLPIADAIINPKRKDCNYPFKKLCGAGVALKFGKCLLKEMGIDSKEADKLIEFCALATVCDVVDLLDENRIIVKKGLEMLNNTNNLGLKALIKETGLKEKNISAYHLGFVIGPCVNATGRLETADLSVELLITEDEKRAEDLAKELFQLNQKRQDLTIESVEMVIDQIEKNNMDKDKVLVVYNPYIHESIAGIVAGRIRERYNVPTIIMTKGKSMPKGSGRSIEEYNMFEELSKCKYLIEKFGGHPMAAGLSVREEALPLLRQELLKNCVLSDEDIIPKVRIDARLPLNLLNEGIIEEINALEPFGKGNNTPIFGERGIEVSRIWLMGREKNIVKFRMKVPNSYYPIDGISFDRFDDFKEQYINIYGKEKFTEIITSSYCDFKMDILFYPSINEYNGNRTIQVIIKSIRF